MYDRGAWFPGVIMSSSRALCGLPSVKKQNNVQVCSDIQNNQGLDKGYQPSASADNSYLDLDYFGYHKKTNPIIAYY